MIESLFLSCALAMPPISFTRPAYHFVSEKEKLVEWLRKNDPGADVFITPEGKADRLKEYGWERVPFTWRGNEIWIRRKEIDDRKKYRESA